MAVSCLLSRKITFTLLNRVNNVSNFVKNSRQLLVCNNPCVRTIHNSSWTSFSSVCCSNLFRHYGTGVEKVHSHKILESFSEKKGKGGDDKNQGNNQSNRSEEEEERLKREAAWRTMKYTLIAIASTFTFSGVYIIVTYGAPIRNEDGMIEDDEFSRLPIVPQYLKRAYKSMVFYKVMIQKPSREKLLPDPLKLPYIQPPYTLVLELTDLLVHPEWTYSTGWRFKKRPGIDQFLEQCGPPNFEIVIYTAEQGMIAFPIISSLDPKGYIMYRLFKDATDYIDGHHVKNLDCLNRDPKRVIVVDWNPNSVKLHRENTILIPRWHGGDRDTALLDLGEFLKTIASNEVDDVRDVLVHYSQFDDPLETFKEKKRTLMEQMEQENAKKREQVTKYPWKSRLS